MELVIPVTLEEKEAVINAISELNKISHVKAMSQAAIATLADIKPTKVRLVLMELLEEKRIAQYQTTENRHLQRYYYVVNELEAEQ